MSTAVLILGSAFLGWFADPPKTDRARAEPRVRASSEDASRSAFPYDIALEVARIEALHRSIVSGPVESWELGRVQLGYEALLKKAPDARTERILRTRLERVASQAEMAHSARNVQTLLNEAHDRDAEVAVVMRTLGALERPASRPYVAEGQIQVSSRQVEGRRVFALIGKEGNTIGYLDVPPGLDVRHLASKRVGVRGSARYNEDLGNRLIAVRDLEALE